MCFFCDLFHYKFPSCPGRINGRPKLERIKGPWYEFLPSHLQQCESALAMGGADEERLVAQLYDRATDIRTLEAAWRWLDNDKIQYPGISGTGRAVNLTDKEMRYLVTHLRNKLRKPGYVVEDHDFFLWPILSRLGDEVGRNAMCLIVQPLLVNGLDPLTLSVASDEASLNSLNVTLDLAGSKKRMVWAKASVKDPFDNVPEQHLFDMVWAGMPNNRCVQLIVDLTGLPSPTGILQGCKLSELLIDFYLDRVVVCEWREIHENVPLLRRGAEFLILCRKKDGAERMRADLVDILGKAGMPVDEAGESSISDLAAGDSAEWLGFAISRQAGEWHYEPTVSA